MPETQQPPEQEKIQSRELLSGEREKTEEELQMIQHMTESLDELFRRFGIDKTPVATQDQLHLFSRESWRESTLIPERYRDSRSGIALTDYKNNRALIMHDDNLDPYDKYALMLHERLHLNSFFQETRRGKRYIDRAGYHARISEQDTNERWMIKYAYLKGYNEALTELITRSIMHDKKEELRERFGIDAGRREEEMQEKLKDEAKTRATEGRYLPQQRVLSILYGYDIKNIPSNVVRGYFTGQMMHLRDIERTFGKGSLRVLASMRHYDAEQAFQCAEYLTAREEEKEALAEKVLKHPHHLERYRKRKKY